MFGGVHLACHRQAPGEDGAVRMVLIGIQYNNSGILVWGLPY